MINNINKQIAALEKKERMLQKRREIFGEKLLKLVNQFSPRGGDEHIREKYYAVLKQSQKNDDDRREVIKLIAKLINKMHELEEKENNKKFINSYGEATERYITSTTYDRAMKRQNKNIMNFVK